MKFNIILLLSFLPSLVFSQGMNNLWLMGYSSSAGYPFGGTDVNFFSGTADTIYHPRQMNLPDEKA